MELERGFRRIALTTSAVIFVAALAFDGYAIDRIVDYRDRLDRWGREFKKCMDNTKVFRESGLAKRLSETQVSRTAIDLIKSCNDTWLPAAPKAPIWYYRNLWMVGGIFLVIGAALSTFPWGVFYLVRWIARGFSS